MKIYLATKRVEHYVNKFIPELVYGLKSAGNDVDVGTDILWTEEVFKYDIIYFHWPEFLFNKATSEDCISLEKRIQRLKNSKKIIVAHCHNLKPHNPAKRIEAELYNIVYGNCDIMIHMGKYSLEKMKKVFPMSKHFFVPHHIYNHFYQFNSEQSLCRKKLGLSEIKCIVLCFGAFRNDEERNLFLALQRKLDHRDFEIVAPSFFRGKIFQKNIKKGFANFLKIIVYRVRGIKFSTKYLSDDEMQKYFCASDVVLIQRPDILNSGNLPMGFSAGKVVVGPNVGNVAELLLSTNNPVFGINDESSLMEAVKKAKIMANDGFGIFNRKYAEENWTPDKIGSMLTSIFREYRDENIKKSS